MDQQVIRMITANELLAETLKLKNEGFRLVAITCSSVKRKEGEDVSAEDMQKDMELTYSFDQGQDFNNLRILTDTKEEIMSISVIYAYSFLYENEIKELFGVNIQNISVDFQDQLYQIPVKTPYQPKKEEK